MTAPTPTSQPTIPMPATIVQPTPAATADTVAPVPPPYDDAPYFDGGDWIALGALIVGAVAAGFAIKARGDSKRSSDAAVRAAKANEDMVVEQRTANRIAAQEVATVQQQRADERAEADARVADQARLIRCEVSDMGGVKVGAQNMSSQPVTGIRLVSIVGMPADWTWQLNPRVMGNRTIYDVLRPGDDRSYFVEFVDGAGEIHRSAGNSYTITLRFTDAQGRRWERVGSGAPRQVPTDDADLDA